MLDISVVLTVLVTAVCLALTTYFIVDALINHDGPYDILESVRRWAGVNQPVIEEAISATTPWLEIDSDCEYESDGSWGGDVFSCPYCMTPYVLLPVAVLYFVLLDISVATAVLAFGVAWGGVWWMLDLAS